MFTAEEIKGWLFSSLSAWSRKYDRESNTQVLDF